MIKVTCPICGRAMQSERIDAWPQFPFCSKRCRLIDLGRWLKEDYRIDSGAEGEAAATPDDTETP
jgi:endogenous inhibitor of DNA gyrase (YacG/DUF329 family)